MQRLNDRQEDTEQAQPARPEKPGGRAVFLRAWAERQLRRRAVSGSALTVGGFAVSNGLRLLSNLVLTRILFPEAFGLMALVAVFMQGLEMFTDVGITTGLIRSRRSRDAVFINTAWTLQVVRGATLALIASLAAVPFAAFYGEPLLQWMIPVAATKSLILGLTSSKVTLAERDIKVGRVVGLEITERVIAIGVSVGWAMIEPTVWALIGGSLAGSLARVAGGYIVFPGKSARFALERNAVRELAKFGRWIFVSTFLTFFLQQGDRAVIGRFADMEVLGVYGVAVLWARIPIDAGLKLSSKILFPSLARANVKNGEDFSLLRPLVSRARLGLLGLLMPVCWLLVLGGSWGIRVLYSDDFVSAGDMVRVLAMGTCAAIVSASAGNTLLVIGDSFRFMLVQVTRGIALIGSMYVGAEAMGFGGLVIGIAAARWFDYPVLAWSLRRHGLWLPGLDIVAFGLSVVVGVVSFAIDPIDIAFLAGGAP